VGPRKLHPDLRRLGRGSAGAGDQPSSVCQGPPRPDPPVCSGATESRYHRPQWPLLWRAWTGQPRTRSRWTGQPGIRIWNPWALRHGSAWWQRLDRDPALRLRPAVLTCRLLSWHALCRCLGPHDRWSRLGGKSAALLLASPEALRPRSVRWATEQTIQILTTRSRSCKCGLKRSCNRRHLSLRRWCPGPASHKDCVRTLH
jgi:hypothetical protein